MKRRGLPALCAIPPLRPPIERSLRRGFFKRALRRGLSAVPARPRALSGVALLAWLVLCFATQAEVPADAPAQAGGVPAAAPAPAPREAAAPEGTPERAEPRAQRAKRQATRRARAAQEARRAKAARARAKRKRAQAKRAEKGLAVEKQNYQELKATWHEPAHAVELSSSAAALIPGLVLYPVGESMPVVLIPQTSEGGFSDAQVEIATRAFGSWKGGPRVHERLLTLIYQAMRHFEVPYVHLISGIRRDRRGSRHSHGFAADIVLPGIEDEQLAAYFRARGFLGVGIYPRSGFVHVDVRERSYFWIDNSPPGRRWKVKPILIKEAVQADEAALARGEGPAVNPASLRRVLDVRARQRMRAAGRGRSRAAAKASKTRVAESGDSGG